MSKISRAHRSHPFLDQIAWRVGLIAALGALSLLPPLSYESRILVL